MYNSDLGRWISPDPMGQFFSPYLAMGNNPVSMTDPSGGYAIIGGESYGFATLGTQQFLENHGYTSSEISKILAYGMPMTPSEYRAKKIKEYRHEKRNILQGGFGRYHQKTLAAIDVLNQRYGHIPLNTAAINNTVREFMGARWEEQFAIGDQIIDNYFILKVHTEEGPVYQASRNKAELASLQDQILAMRGILINLPATTIEDARSGVLYGMIQYTLDNLNNLDNRDLFTPESNGSYTFNGIPSLGGGMAGGLAGGIGSQQQMISDVAAGVALFSAEVEAAAILGTMSSQRGTYTSAAQFAKQVKTLGKLGRAAGGVGIVLTAASIGSDIYNDTHNTSTWADAIITGGLITAGIIGGVTAAPVVALGGLAYGIFTIAGGSDWIDENFGYRDK